VQSLQINNLKQKTIESSSVPPSPKQWIGIRANAGCSLPVSRLETALPPPTKPVCTPLSSVVIDP